MLPTVILYIWYTCTWPSSLSLLWRRSTCSINVQPCESDGRRYSQQLPHWFHQMSGGLLDQGSPEQEWKESGVQMNWRRAWGERQWGGMGAITPRKGAGISTAVHHMPLPIPYPQTWINSAGSGSPRT